MDLFRQFVSLLLLGTGILTLSVLRFRKRLS